MRAVLLVFMMAGLVHAQPMPDDWPPKISPDGYSILMQDDGIERWVSGGQTYDKVWTEVVVGSPNPRETVVIEMWVRDWAHPTWDYKLVMTNVINTGPNGFWVGYMFAVAPIWMSLPTEDSVDFWGFGYDVRCRVKRLGVVKASDASWITEFKPYPPDQ